MYQFIVAFTACLVIKTVPIIGLTGYSDEKFEFTRVEPGNEIGITTKVIAHIHRPAKSTTETWTLNREFTPDEVVKALNSTCSKKIIDRRLKWENCQLDKDGFTAELTHGRPESKNKTFVYLAMSYVSYKRLEKGRKLTCKLSIVEENPVYFLMETFSKLPSNDSFPKSHQESVDTVHLHQLGKFGKEFLSIYGDSIDQDGIYNFDVMDYYERDEVYECFLSIGSSESVSVLEEKCPFYCVDRITSLELMEELDSDLDDSDLDHDHGIYIIRRNRGGKDAGESDDETIEIAEDPDEEEEILKRTIHIEL